MLEFELKRAMAPDEMEETPCGVCGTDFRPEAVIANLATDHEFFPTCEACLRHLAGRAEGERIPADWGDVYRRYVAGVREHPEPVFPSLEALLEAERRCPPGHGLAVPEL